jgi:hypothetical protein
MVIFQNFFVTLLTLKNLLKLQLFIPYMLKKSEKNSDMFKGGKKIAKLLLFSMIDSVFCCFEHSFEPQSDSF